jgi:hypothetical protein
MPLNNLCNTKIFCLMAMRVSHPTPMYAEFIVRQRWPESKQVEKKSVTIRRHLDELVRAGYAWKCGAQLYLISASGQHALSRSVDDYEDSYSTKSPGNRAPMLKVVK